MGNYFVLLKNANQFQIGPLSQIWAAYKKIPVFDATFIMKKSWGLLGENLDEKSAVEMAAAFKEKNIDTFILSSEKLIRLPEASSFLDKNFSLESFEWDQVKVLGAAAIKSGSQKTIEEKQGPSIAQKAVSIGIGLTTGIPIRIGPKQQTVKKTIHETELEFYLDLVLSEPLRHVRISANHVNYGYLKERMLTNSMGNFRLMLKDIVAKVPHALPNAGMEILLQGRPVNTMGYESLTDLDKECEWLYNVRPQRDSNP